MSKMFCRLVKGWKTFRKKGNLHVTIIFFLLLHDVFKSLHNIYEDRDYRGQFRYTATVFNREKPGPTVASTDAFLAHFSVSVIILAAVLYNKHERKKKVYYHGGSDYA